MDNYGKKLMRINSDLAEQYNENTPLNEDDALKIGAIIGSGIEHDLIEIKDTKKRRELLDEHAQVYEDLSKRVPNKSRYFAEKIKDVSTYWRTKAK